MRVSIHAPRVGRDLRAAPVEKRGLVSIHAPRVGRDKKQIRTRCVFASFNSRAPRGARLAIHRPRFRYRSFNSRAPRGARRSLTSVSLPQVQFQFTRPAWGATCRRCCRRPPSRCFNSRAPRGARPWLGRHDHERGQVSIHAPRVGRDSPPRSRATDAPAFQFTRPAWGATFRR